MNFFKRGTIFDTNSIGLGLVALFILFIGFVALYSPLLSLYVSLITLCIPVKKSYIFRFLISSIIIYSMAVVCASRSIYMARGDDFLGVYLPLYQYLTHGGSVFYEDFSGGVEFILPLLFKVMIMIGVSKKVTILTTFLMLLLLLFYIWIELFFKKSYKNNDKSLVIASIFGFLFFAVISQQMRQALSTVFLLYYLYFLIKGFRLLSFFFIVLAFLTHLSAIPIAIILWVIVTGGKKRILLTVAMMLFSWLFFGILNILTSSSFLGVVAYKFNYYIYNESLSFSSFLYYCPVFILCGFFFKVDKDTIDERIKGLILYTSIYYIILLPIPLASDRVLMYGVIFLKGFFVYYCFKNYIYIYRYVLIAFLCFKLLTMWYITPSPANGISSFWADFAPAGDTALYYFK
ncbi:EpsG family protein [Pluralibacter gergoviae]|nr:EpsG family protein [Pluralibacter gergoviae]ELC3016782.1 EpsG family protein [Pluralibacter gergoviae]ELC3022301.1 EpsG family protein [Pluralibacter gergoviae]